MLDLQLATLPEIAAQYETDERNWVRANMIASQDGHFVGAGDSSRDLTGESDLKLLLLLRALSDAVLVGANTARLEGYRQPKRRDEYTFLNRPVPRLVIVSASLDFDVTSNLFHGGEHRTLVVNAGELEPNQDLLEVADVIAVKNDHTFAHSLIDALATMNILRITCEGGPTLLTKLLAARMVNEYDLTISPITVGGTAQWPEALPHITQWEEVASATSGEFEFKRLLQIS
jgi:5-amino-6-(5-phosphoribosylamino)uracil reductase